MQEQRIIEFDYYYEKGMMRRRIEPAFVVFQWTAWYVFGYCLDRQDFRMFKLQRLWNLKLSEASFVHREIPPEKRDFNTRLPDDKKLVAVFHPSTKYRLIETYGLHCTSETEDGNLHLEIGYTHWDNILTWLLGFGDKVTVLEPPEMAQEICEIAKRMMENYK